MASSTYSAVRMWSLEWGGSAPEPSKCLIYLGGWGGERRLLCFYTIASSWLPGRSETTFCRLVPDLEVCHPRCVKSNITVYNVYVLTDTCSEKHNN